MQDLPKSILGDITALTISTPDLEKSLAYYRQLGFSEVLRADFPFPWIQISDGVLLIMLRKDPNPYLALTYYVKNIDLVVKGLEEKKISFIQKPGKKDLVKRYIFQSPDGLTISLVNITDGFRQPPGPGMLQMPQQDYFNPDKYVNKSCGLFGELAHPVYNLEESIAFWELLGFKPLSVYQSPYPWAIVSDGLGIVGLHQSDHFSYPAITYFAADMQEKINRLIKKGLQNYAEQNNGNIELTTPEQQHIFLFSLGGGNSNKKKEIEQPVLETNRLFLREVNAEILDQLYTTCSDEYIISFLGLNSAEELNIERGNWQLGYTTYRTTFKTFLLQEKDSGRIIGKAGFHNWYPLHRRSEIGYVLSDESAKRKGYTTEAMETIVKYGFEILGLNRLEAFASPDNIASVKILRGLGMTEEGLLRSHFYKNGKMEDSICFAMLQHEYAARKK